MARRRSKFEPSQADNRRFTRWRDQHNRLWEGVLDIKNGFPVGPITLSEVEPPLIPPQKYFKWPALSDGTFRIDYAQWISDREEGKRMYERRKIKYAQAMYGENAGQVLAKDTLPPEFLRIVGTEPQPVEPVLAAASGNRWVLGLSEEKPEWADKFFKDEPEQPRRSRRAEGLDLERLRERFPDAEVEDSEDEDEVSAEDAEMQRLSEETGVEFEMV